MFNYIPKSIFIRLDIFHLPQLPNLRRWKFHINHHPQVWFSGCFWPRLSHAMHQVRQHWHRFDACASVSGERWKEKLMVVNNLLLFPGGGIGVSLGSHIIDFTYQIFTFTHFGTTKTCRLQKCCETPIVCAPSCFNWRLRWSSPQGSHLASLILVASVALWIQIIYPTNKPSTFEKKYIHMKLSLRMTWSDVIN